MAKALLAALAPMLLFIGHWEIVVPLPGADAYLVLGVNDDHHTDPGDHSQHCHGNAASCSDVPLTALSGLALLAQHLAAPAHDGQGQPVGVGAAGPHPDHVERPELPPPQA